MSVPQANAKQWKHFIETFTKLDGDSNVNADFTKITQTSGVAYFEFVRAMWICTGEYMSEQEFCKINGNIPHKFFEQKIRDHEETARLRLETIVIEY